MHLVLCTKQGAISSAALRFYMWSEWSHSAIWDEELDVVTHSTFWGDGVHESHTNEFFEEYTKYETQVLHVSPELVPAARAWLREQVGKRYDATALVGIYFRRDWQEDDSWFCSELTEKFIQLFVGARFRTTVNRITPAHQAMLVLPAT